MSPDHLDHDTLAPIVAEITRLSGGIERLEAEFPELVQRAVDFVVDPVRTARTLISELDSVEKTFIGLKIEHFLRDFLGVPKGIRDLRIGDTDVDVKSTVAKTWMIPPETFTNKEPCALVMVASEARLCSFGVFVAREEYLNAANRDKKRSVSAKALPNIWWLLQDRPLPESRFSGINMRRFRELRAMRGGSRRTAQFFRENLGRVVHRSVIQGLLPDQNDYMKRLRRNRGAGDILENEGIVILSGTYDSSLIESLGLPFCKRDEFVATNVGVEEAKRLWLESARKKK